MAKSTSRRSSKPSRLRVAFIGAGGIAGTHMDCLAKMDDVEIVAISDVSEKAISSRAAQFNIPHTFTDYQKMLAEIKPDAVSVCTPNGLHAPAAIAALNAGAHVLVEKPMAMNAVEGQQMIDAAKANKRKLVIAFQWRFDPKTSLLRKAVQQGTFGKVLYTRAQALRRRGIPNWGVFGRKDLQGGGPLIDIGVHILEVAHFTMGAPRPVAASGNVFTYIGDKKSDIASMWPNWDHKTYTVEDLAVGQIRFEGGQILTLESSFAAHIREDAFTFQIMGEKGGATWDPPTIFNDSAGHMLNSTPAFLPQAGFGGNFGAKMRDFVEHVLYDKPTLNPAEHGLMVQKMLDGIYRSAETGREVAID